jgi:hypothetical protein
MFSFRLFGNIGGVVDSDIESFNLRWELLGGFLDDCEIGEVEEDVG